MLDVTINKIILDKYDSVSLSTIIFEEILEDYIKIKSSIESVLIKDMLTFDMYINKIGEYTKWKYCKNIDLEIIEILKKEYPTLLINSEQVINNINILRENIETLYKVELFILKMLDKQYKTQYKINDNFFQNTVIETMSYLEFRVSIRLKIKKVFEKYKENFNEIDKIIQNMIEKIP